LILICWIAAVLTLRLFTSIPFTRRLTPPVPSVLLSRNREMAATASSSKTGRLSSVCASSAIVSALAAAPVATRDALSPVTVTSW
jgi:hypothetical protein